MIEFLEYRGISKYKFYKDVNLSNGFLDKEGSMRSDICEKISYEYDDLNLNWLITGKGKMILETEDKSVKQEKSYNNGEKSLILSEKNDQYETKIFKLRTDYPMDDQVIPLYDLEATAGLVALFNNQKDLKPIDVLRIPNLSKCDGSLYVTGDSMYPLLKSGDIIAYKQIYDFNSDIFWGEMYLISVEVSGEEWVTVKYIHKSELGNEYIKLVSQNTNHQPKDVLLGKVRAMALIKASVRINSMY